MLDPTCPMENGRETRKIVWKATDASLRDGTFSAIAGIEVLFSVAIYWGVAIYFETQLHLLISLLVSPLLLLRSVQSIALGVRWLENYWDRRFDDVLENPISALRSYRFIISIFSALLVGTAVTHLLSLFIIRDAHGLSAALRGFLVGFLAMQAAVAITAAGAAKQIVAITRIALGWLVTGLAVAALTAAAGAVRIAGGSIPACAAAGIAAACVLAAGAINASEAASIAVVTRDIRAVVIGREAARQRTFAFLVVFLGLLIGAWLRTVAIRFAATIRYLIPGIKTMPQNWWRTLFATDLFCAPEIVPGYNRADHLNFRFLTSRFKQEERSYKRLLYILILAGWFGPAYFYRICIKSTCWFYMPLVYVVRRPALSENPGLLRDLLWRDPMEWCRRFLAALTLTGFAMTTLLPPLAAFLKSTMPLIMVSPLEYLFLIDIRSIKLWQWFSLGSASITFGILSLIGTFSIYYAHSHLDSRLARKTYNRARTLEYLRRFRNVSTAFFFATAGIHTLLWLTSGFDVLPSYIQQLLRWMYGNALPSTAT